MRRRVATLVFLGCLLLPATPSLALDVHSPAELVEFQEELDGMTVTVEGEAIGDKMNDMGDGVWVNVLGGEVAVGIFMDDEQVDGVSMLGDYGHTGDGLSVVGEFHAACPEHGGDLDVHADSLTVISPGHEVDRPVRAWPGIVGIALIGVSAGLAQIIRGRQLGQLP